MHVLPTQREDPSIDLRIVRYSVVWGITGRLRCSVFSCCAVCESQATQEQLLYGMYDSKSFQEKYCVILIAPLNKGLF